MAGSSTRRLLYLLGAAALVVVIAITVDLSLERLSAARARGAHYEAQTRTLQQALAPESDLLRERDELNRDMARRVTRFYSVDALTPYAFGTLVKKKLVSCGMSVTRYQIVEVKGRSFLEFSISGSARGLLLFLGDVSQQDKFWVIPSITVSTRQNSDIVDVVFRIGYEIIDTKSS